MKKIITTHKGSDFDALASLAAAHIIYPDAVPVLPGYVNQNLKPFLAIHKDLFDFYNPREVDPDEVSTLIVVDTHDWNRLDKDLESLRHKPGLEIIVWDHHMNGDMEPAEAHIRETGATVTMLVQEIQEQRKLITPIQATLFLIGLYEDTGNLTFPSTLPEDAHAAGFLLDRKADLTILATFLKQAYSKAHKEILSEMIETGERFKLSGFNVSFAEIEVRGQIQNLAMVVQMYREIINVDAVFGIFRDADRDRVMVIGRSAVDEINIGLIMRALHGGGHPGAGSALVKSAKPAAVREMIVELINGNQHSSVMLSDIMSYPVMSVHENTPVEEVVTLITDLGCSGMPITAKDDETKLVGVISRRDFKRIKKDRHMQSPIKAFMSRNPRTIPHDRSAVEAARLMIKHDIGRLPVIQNDKMIGIITRSDVMTYFYDLVPD